MSTDWGATGSIDKTNKNKQDERANFVFCHMKRKLNLSSPAPGAGGQYGTVLCSGLPVSASASHRPPRCVVG